MLVHASIYEGHKRGTAVVRFSRVTLVVAFDIRSRSGETESV
jgi:hypothetical protein